MKATNPYKPLRPLLILLRDITIIHLVGATSATLVAIFGIWVFPAIAYAPVVLLIAPVHLILMGAVIPFYFLAALIYLIPLSLALEGLAKIRFLSAIHQNALIAAIFGFIFGFLYWEIRQDIAPIISPDKPGIISLTFHMATAIAGASMSVCSWKFRHPAPNGS